jgi:hypothetical protein
LPSWTVVKIKSAFFPTLADKMGETVKWWALVLLTTGSAFHIIIVWQITSRFGRFLCFIDIEGA